MRELRDLQLELLSRETGKQQRFGSEHRSQKLDHSTHLSSELLPVPTS